jgi:hypothetical protein
LTRLVKPLPISFPAPRISASAATSDVADTRVVVTSPRRPARQRHEFTTPLHTSGIDKRDPDLLGATAPPSSCRHPLENSIPSLLAITSHPTHNTSARERRWQCRSLSLFLGRRRRAHHIGTVYLLETRPSSSSLSINLGLPGLELEPVPIPPTHHPPSPS